jgi:3-phenylpropionate/trans-cinnamate dioxygenase ferredoxin reductase subunit
MSQKQAIVIVGAGHGGVNAAAFLRDEGFDGTIKLVCAETQAPYQRPPLSKAYLKGEATAESLILRGPTFYTDQRVDLISGVKVETLDRAGRKVGLSDGSSLAYDHLILATGAAARPAGFPGMELAGVLTLRDLGDAEKLKPLMEKAKRIAVIGAGFIGLEFAATAVAKGAEVDVVEFAPRVMGRAVSAPLSDFYGAFHVRNGAQVHLGVGVAAFEGRNGVVTSVYLTDGRRLPVDLVVVGIGILPKQRLAAVGGLAVSNGVETDEFMTTSDENVSAIGDVTLHPNAFAGKTIRLESVQNALDQARVVAKNLTGKKVKYDAVPWFWSDQANLKLQIAGLTDGCDAFVARGDMASGAFSVFCFAKGRLRCVESVNKPADHMIARRLLASPHPNLTPEQAGDIGCDIKALAMAKPA